MEVAIAQAGTASIFNCITATDTPDGPLSTDSARSMISALRPPISVLRRVFLCRVTRSRSVPMRVKPEALVRVMGIIACPPPVRSAGDVP